MHEGKSYGIEGNTQGVTLRTEAQELTDFEFKSSSKVVFTPFDAAIATRFSGILKTDSTLRLHLPADLEVLPEK